MWRALKSLDGSPDLPHPQRYVTSQQYLAYCAWAEDNAAGAATEADVIEDVLFAEGRRLAEAEGEARPEQRTQ